MTAGQETVATTAEEIPKEIIQQILNRGPEAKAESHQRQRRRAEKRTGSTGSPGIRKQVQQGPFV